METTVETGRPGTITITETNDSADGDPPASSYSLFGFSVDITAPDGSTDKPLALTFELHNSLLSETVALEDVRVFRNGAVVPNCVVAGTVAPDPCVSSRSLQSDGDMEIVVLTSKASKWVSGVPDNACPDQEVPAYSLADVPEANVHRADIRCALWWDLMWLPYDGSGWPGFVPAGHVTRGEMATLVAHAIDVARPTQLPATGPDAFTDDDGSPHQEAIDRLARVRIVRGSADGRFSPDAVARRGQLAAVLAETLEYLIPRGLVAADDAFPDDDGSGFERAIDELAGEGLGVGLGAELFEPWEPLRRDQLASFLVRLMDVLVRQQYISPHDQ